PMAKRRKFTAKFKAEVVLEALSGQSSQAELCQRHNLSENQVSTWKRQLLENVETFFASETDKPSSESAERIAQLEQLVGRLTLALEIEKKASTLLD
ncbi:MAG: transposase, partial [Candidatus Poribacteria bacterium]|nr:transposase [Candidatus Poribacteria bacterium]